MDDGMVNVRNVVVDQFVSMGNEGRFVETVMVHICVNMVDRNICVENVAVCLYVHMVYKVNTHVSLAHQTRRHFVEFVDFTRSGKKTISTVLHVIQKRRHNRHEVKSN